MIFILLFFRRNLDFNSQEEAKNIESYISNQSVSSLAVDWIQDRLYWTVDGLLHVVVSDLDGNDTKQILTENKQYVLTNLDNIIIDPYEK